MRAAKTTKEIGAIELEQLTKPEARETAAFDAAELQGLLEQSRHEDDLAIPAGRAVSSNVVSMPRASTSSNRAPVTSAPPTFAAASGEVPIAAASPAFAASSGEVPRAASDRAASSPGASALIPMTTNFDDEPDHYSTTEPLSSTLASSPTVSAIPSRVARGSAGTPKAHRPLTKPPEGRTTSLVLWLVVALAATVVFALAMWR